MRVLEIVGDPAFAEIVGPSELAWLEARINDSKPGKPTIPCLARGKDVPAKKEEIIRQLWLRRLTQDYRYPIERITCEYPVTFGRDTSKRADIVVFDEDRRTVPYIMIEVKAPKLKDGKDQLNSYTHATGAPLALWSSGYETKVWNRLDPNQLNPIPDIPRADQTIEDIANEPWTIDDLIENEKDREKAAGKAQTLRDLIVEMEDDVLANAGVDVFEEVFKLIFTKLYDEKACHSGINTHLIFRNSNTSAQLKKKIQSLFEKANEEWPGVFPKGDQIRLSPDHLKVVVASLESWKLFNSNLDIIDDAFEYLSSKSSKGEKGQYFTPRWVIDMCVKMLNPQESESVIDTAAGSAGFTVHTMFHVWGNIMDELGLPRSNLFTMDAKPARCTKYVGDKAFAIDFDEKSVRVSRCLNLIAGDGDTNVLHLNTLDWANWDEAVKQDEWSDTYGPGWTRLRKLRADPKSNEYRAFNFDVLMANPPFAGDIKQRELLARYELGHKENGKYESKVGRDLLFIERNLDFLKPGGRMAVVLPQGRFNNSSDARVRKFIMERCRILAVVGLHPNTFKPHTGTKTSVLFVQKWNDDPAAGPVCPKQNDYEIFFATQQAESVNNRGEKVYVTDPETGQRIRDEHGHFIVRHDLFNHEGITQDGIAEAFQQFAAKERLSFFR
ncbi:N-6 DNA methylase [Novosphingobium sp.]|uniref:N-6 DNA methylase n=1 Tax=Novosphingobium sp. TaxID=1874826 RepID=UPI00286A2344|nr:N-6 DNA methylase [Novosphingobium sp.]